MSLPVVDIDELNRATVRRLLPIWIRNAVTNASRLKTAQTIDAILGKYHGKAAIVVASGPSLNKQFGTLHFFRGSEVVLVCCDSAYKPLIDHEIVPDYVVAVDPKPQNKVFFQGTESRHGQSCLIASSVVHPAVLEAWKGPLVLFNPELDYSTDFWAALPYLVGNFGSVAVGGSVLSAAVSIVVSGFMCDRVALVGADFCWYGDSHHVSGAIVPKFSDAVEVPCNGQMAYTSPPLLAYLQWFQQLFSAPFVRDDGKLVEFVNCTEGGLLDSAFAPNIPLKHFLHSL